MMNMTKREYAEKVASYLNCKVKEVDKGNGIIFTGIEFPSVNGIAPVFYIDEFYNRNEEVLITVAIIEKQYKEKEDYLNLTSDDVMEKVRDFDNVKHMFRLRLVNKKTKVEVFRDAKEYGFKDLIVYPVIMLSDSATTKVTKGLIDLWSIEEGRDVTDDVFRIALENLEDDFMICSMFDALSSGMGLEEGTEEYYIAKEEFENAIPMFVVSNKAKVYGAACILTNKAKEMLGGHWVVLPSSVHEVIALPFSDGLDMRVLCNMVNEVNGTEVAPTEVLSDRPYLFVGK